MRGYSGTSGRQTSACKSSPVVELEGSTRSPADLSGRMAHRVDASRPPSGKGGPVRILLVQPAIAPPGGGKLVVAWMLEAVRDEHRVRLLTFAPRDLANGNRVFGAL